MSERLTLRALELRRTSRTLAARVGGAAHATDRRDTIELDLQAESAGRALIGLGEAAPLPRYSIDTLDEVEAALLRVRTSLPWSLPLDEGLLEELGACGAALPPAARAALELAVLDTAGQARGRPLWSLLRAEPPAAVSLCAVLDAPQPGLREQSERFAAAGLSAQKRKLGPDDLDGIIDALQASSAAGRIALRLDANRGWAPERFAERSAELASLRPSFIEEPIEGDLAAWLLGAPSAALGALRYAADESLARPTQAEALTVLRRFAPAITVGRLAAVVLKPARDGLLGAYALGRTARRLGAQVIVTHMWDGPRGHLGAAHLAVALGSVDAPAQGLAAHDGLGHDASDPARAYLMAQLEGGRLAIPARPGLGASAGA